MAKITDAERVESVHIKRRRNIRAQYDIGVSIRALRQRLGLPLLTIRAVIHCVDQPEEVHDQSPLDPSDAWDGVIYPGWAVHGEVVAYSRRKA